MRAGSTITRALLYCGAALMPALVLGCGKGNVSRQNANETTAAAATPPTGATTTTSAGEVAPSPEISGWTDNNIVAKLAAADRGEVQAGRLAEAKATSPAVKQFARMIVTDHSKNARDVRALEAKAKLPAKTAANDSTRQAGSAMLKKLRSMAKGPGWDSTFVQDEIAAHQHDIADVQAMQDQAKDAQLKQLLGNVVPVLQTHLQTAQNALGQIASAPVARHKTSAAKKHTARSKY